MIVLFHHLADQAVDLSLIDGPAFVDIRQPRFRASQQEVVDAARNPERHGIAQAKPLPCKNAPRGRRLAVLQRQQTAHHPARARRTCPLGVFGLPRDRLRYGYDIHHRAGLLPAARLSVCRHACCPLSCRCLSARTMPQTLTFAVPKGRILDEALPVMARAGVVPEDAFHDKANRSLTFATTREDMRLIRVRAFDVATFVAHGAAQMGIVGSDVVEEFDYAELYAPVDLDFGHCHLAVAEPKDAARDIAGASHLRVATKYPNLTRRHFEALGIQAECVKLNGAMEIAPELGLAGRIVDLVSTGTTLRENGLVETSRILDISARLIVNRAALKTDSRVGALVEAFRADAAARLAAKDVEGKAA